METEENDKGLPVKTMCILCIKTSVTFRSCFCPCFLFWFKKCKDATYPWLTNCGFK